MKINTSNPGKFAEFKRLFAERGINLEATQFDLKEIDSDPFTVVAHKASQIGEMIIIEDTSLDIEGANVGVNVRYMLDHLQGFIGRRAEWIVLLAYRQNNSIFIYKGSIFGTITEARGSHGFGFDPVFLPDGAQETLAESKPDCFNARAKAVTAFINQEVFATRPVIEDWSGLWQDE